MVKDDKTVPVGNPKPGLSLFSIGRKEPDILDIPKLIRRPRLTRDVKPPFDEVALEDGKEGIPQTSVIGPGRVPEWPVGRSFFPGESHLACIAVEPPRLLFGGGQLLKQDPACGTDQQKKEEEKSNLQFAQLLLFSHSWNESVPFSRSS